MLLSLTVLVCASAEPALHVTSSPHGAHLVRVALMTQEQVENAPIESLSLVQLHAEDVRLSSPPSIAAPVGLLAGGGSLFVLFGLLTYGCVVGANQSTGWDTLGWILLGLITGVVTAAGGVVATIGGILLPGKLMERDAYAERRVAVHARMDAIRSGQVAEPLQAPGEDPRAQSDLLALEAEKPGLGFPITFMAVGAPVAIVGALYYSDSTHPSAGTSSGTIPPLAVGIALIVAGLAMEGIGIWQLISRIQARGEIDDKMRDLQQGPGVSPPPPPPPADLIVPPPPPPPPSGASLPPLPVQFAFAFHF